MRGVDNSVADNPVARALIEFVGSEPGMTQRLRAQHVDDGSGRCVLCSAGAQTGHYRHPCVLRLAADEANRRLAASGLA
jgi:hypothetical protein